MSAAVVLFRSVEFGGTRHSYFRSRATQQAVDEEEGGWLAVWALNNARFRSGWCATFTAINRARFGLVETLTRFSGPISHRLWADRLKHRPH